MMGTCIRTANQTTYRRSRFQGECICVPRQQLADARHNRAGIEGVQLICLLNKFRRLHDDVAAVLTHSVRRLRRYQYQSKSEHRELTMVPSSSAYRRSAVIRAATSGAEAAACAWSVVMR